ncbi:hypothetical protein LF1_11380 [Rubripirellula obstinata]|uniref:Replication initiator protein A n=1 Tax=Rubripirellula obstinata TaxID=406547 RepID=A0A5B1CDF4_9BACT|nr:hypothetical protein [Rubripirellula obstinata]KAA1258616.1 hypothetical protein LF1_11380 [Rubripirellula obstinata]
MKTTSQTRPTTRRPKTSRHCGLAQHSLVEHALCPIDARVSITPGLLHDTSYQYTDRNRNRKTANVQVASPFGLSPNDELYLFGLLSLTFAQNDPQQDFYATPHWCLRQLGIVDANNQQAQRYQGFRDAIRRLAGVVYTNDAFFDPIRGEHRDVAFGFLKYSLPIDPNSSRAWHFVHDSQWFEMCRAVQGSFSFDFASYRQLDYASRRLFLLLQKVFYRLYRSPSFEIRQLAVGTLGFSDRLATKEIKQKLTRCIEKLVDQNVIALPDDCKSVKDLFRKESKGRFTVTFDKGTFFDGGVYKTKFSVEDSPLYDPLRKIGFDSATIHRLSKKYATSLLQQWADITLSAIEQKRINQSPEAFFQYHVKLAAARRTTPPDWWRELRREEFEQQRANQPESEGDDRGFEEFLESEGREAFERVMNRLMRGLQDAGQSPSEAKANATYSAKMNLRKLFRQKGDSIENEPTSMASILNQYKQ